MKSAIALRYNKAILNYAAPARIIKDFFFSIYYALRAGCHAEALEARGQRPTRVLLGLNSMDCGAGPSNSNPF